MKKIKERAEQGTITIKDKTNGSKEARITLNFGGGKSKRFAKCGKSVDLAVSKLVDEITNYLDMMIQNSLITCKINDNIGKKLVKSINNLDITTSEVAEKVMLIINKINNFNKELDLGLVVTNNITLSSGNSNSDDILNNTKKNIQTLDLLDDIALEWKKYELSLCEYSDENVNPLSQKTVDGYIYILDRKIIPFLKKRKVMYLQQITSDIIQELLKDTKGYNSKRHIYIVFSLLFKHYTKKLHNNPLADVKKPVKPNKPSANKKKSLTCIAPDKIDDYVKIFKEENTDLSKLLIVMIKTGLRPEEVCSLNWKNLDIAASELIIEDAYKDFVVYDENYNPIGHTRRKDKLKTKESERVIPISKELVDFLLRHKEEQKQRFKNSVKMKKKSRKWSEDEYMFLSRTYRPYVSDTLSSALPKLCDKYGIERVSPYTLRHTFASNFSSKCDDTLALQSIMGHSDFHTTQQYYITVFNDRKRKAMEQVYAAI